MPYKSIKLGKTFDSPINTPVTMGGSGEEYFPGLCLELPEGAELPDEGVLTVRYRVNRETTEKKEGKCRYDLDITELQDVKATKSEKEEYSGDVLDKLRDEAE